MSFLVSPTAFFQTNIEAAEAIVTLVLEAADALAPGSHVLDLYAGSGLFALPLAAKGHTVSAVEENVHAVRDADANLRLNKLHGGTVRLYASRVEDALRTMKREPFDLVVVDPPREGLPPPVVRHLFGRMAPPLAVYISCNPEALAAELPAIREHGYEILRVQPVDMFPHTTHIETVVVLRKVPKVPRVPKVQGAAPQAP